MNNTLRLVVNNDNDKKFEDKKIGFISYGSGSKAKIFEGTVQKNWIEKTNTIKQITSYNNFYELGTNKKDPKKNESMLKTDPWSVSIEGECEKPGVIALEDLIRPQDLEERIINNGGNISSSVSKKTYALIVGSDPGSKLDKAKKLEVKIMTEEKFINLK